MRVKHTFIDIAVEDFQADAETVPRQMSEPAPSSSKSHMSTFKYVLETIPTSDTLPKAEMQLSSTSSDASDSDTESDQEHQKASSRNMLESRDAAELGEIPPLQCLSGVMERQVIEPSQMAPEMQMPGQCWWASADLAETPQTMEPYPSNMVLVQDSAMQACVMPQGCVLMPLCIVPGTEVHAPFGQVAIPENAMPESVAPVTSTIKAVSDEWDNVHTIMMRNLPNKYTQHLLIEELNSRGFSGTFDFIYVPVDPDTDANRGYAFINFDQASDARRFKEEFDGYQMSYFESSKFVTVTPATLQGFEANYAHYANARVNRGDPSKRPIFLRESEQPGGKSRRSGRRHGKSMIDVALRAKDKKAAAVKAAMQQAVTESQEASKPHVVMPPTAMQSTSGIAAAQQATSARKFCASCGGNRCPGDKFCTFCGSSLA
eukprot:gnl/TRDRNA2_/TRDRNA2_174215_c0_seq14.p1 gnl/TRDRNA2_/TRDRNA2_174215_c0~~gnl/TRDRNA2_/TRDRNA2_174215_c0_seq14.p1  ORF type:complete len:454 (-),score=97.06 gnl/TRDRNA2_/TRDRNA2_174215_c0_seq14:888-2183(-)